MAEAEHRAAVMDLFRKECPRAVVFRHEDSLRAGIPDTSINWKRLTSWWEFKHGNPTIKWRGAQSAELRRLWSTGIPAYYVIFQERDGERATLIVPATESYRNLQTPHYATNFSYRFVVEFFKLIHGRGVTP